MTISLTVIIGLKGYLYAGLGMVPILLAEGKLAGYVLSLTPRFLMTPTGVLALRVYAIYSKSRRVLIFLVFLLLCSFAVNVAQAVGLLPRQASLEV